MMSAGSGSYLGTQVAIQQKIASGAHVFTTLCYENIQNLLP